MIKETGPHTCEASALQPVTFLTQPIPNDSWQRIFPFSQNSLVIKSTDI